MKKALSIVSIITPFLSIGAFYLLQTHPILAFIISFILAAGGFAAGIIAITPGGTTYLFLAWLGIVVNFMLGLSIAFVSIVAIFMG